uniref:Gamma-aminobutyric acid type A receptor subunit gamma3 n=1 Tax=Cairina moschata TaxID=8855 RepID=A0A8C3GLY7_CAIMO
MPAKLLAVFFLLSVFHARSRKVEEDEYEDGTTNQKWVLAPKTQDTDVTLILNKLLREYDKKLRPDIGIKPTVIDVDIYVNSIGPVSSINMPLQDAVHHNAVAALHGEESLTMPFVQIFSSGRRLAVVPTQISVEIFFLHYK